MKRTISRLLLGAMIVAAAFSFNGNVVLQQEASVVKAATLGEENALAKAKTYLSFMAFSKKGLKEQLIFDGFTKSEAKYAVKNCGANWKKQAYKKAKSYLDIMSFSKQGLKEQLIFDGFTEKQADYAVKKVGF